jgi:hypothetical protein
MILDYFVKHSNATGYFSVKPSFRDSFSRILNSHIMSHKFIFANVCITLEFLTTFTRVLKIAKSDF